MHAPLNLIRSCCSDTKVVSKVRDEMDACAKRPCLQWIPDPALKPKLRTITRVHLDWPTGPDKAEYM